MRKYKVHNVKFYQPEPTAIHCLTYEEKFKKLALSRSNSLIEIWDFKATPYQEKQIVLGSDEGSIEALVWRNNRLFSTGLQGYVQEYDLKKLLVKHKEFVISGPAWCLSLSQDGCLLAAGTENGDISIFSILSNGIKHYKNFTKQEARVLALSWYENSFVASGSLDSIRIWNFETGQTVQRINTGRSSKNHETIVWCVRFLSDFTVVSGDSRGKTCFWNGNTGSLIENFQSHSADILCMEVDQDQNRIYSAGVDPIIVEFSKVYPTRHDANSKSKWTIATSRNIHTHDIRALVKAEEFLASGGVDSYLVLSSYRPKLLLKSVPTPHKAIIHVAQKARCVLFQYETFLEIWKLGACDQEATGNNDDLLPFSSNPQKLLVLKAKSNSKILSSAFSEDGQWISYSTLNKLMLYKFSIVYENEFTPKVTLNPVYSLPPECSSSARQLSFVPNENKLLVINNCSELQVVLFDDLQGSLHHTFPSVNEEINLLKISKDGKFAAVASNDGNIQIYNLVNLNVHCTLPRYCCQASAIAFQPKSDYLHVVYTDHSVVIFDPVQKKYTDWSRELTNLSKSWASQNYAFLSISFDARDPNVLVLHSDNTLAIIEKSDGKPRKFLKASEYKKISSAFSHSNNLLVRSCKKYKHLLYFGQIQGDEMLAVELSPCAIFDKLPPALKRKKFGT